MFFCSRNFTNKNSLMKKIKLPILLMLTLVLMVSCSEDGDDGQSGFSNAELVGTWVLVEVNLSSEVDVDGDGQSSRQVVPAVDECRPGGLLLAQQPSPPRPSTRLLSHLPP